MKCLTCKFKDIREYGAKGFLKETLIFCEICNDINGGMEDCPDYEQEAANE